MELMIVLDLFILIITNCKVEYQQLKLEIATNNESTNAQGKIVEQM